MKSIINNVLMVIILNSNVFWLFIQNVIIKKKKELYNRILLYHGHGLVF